MAADRVDEADLQLVRDFYRNFAEGRLDVLREHILAAEVVWRVPGRHSLSGTYHGVDEIMAFFGLLSASRFQVEMYFLKADGGRVVDVHRGWSGRGDGTDIDLTWVTVYRIEGGRIVEAQNFVSDQAVADTFFLAAHPLAPLPGRLAVPTGEA